MVVGEETPHEGAVSVLRWPTFIGSVDPDALKIPARRAEYSLTESALSPFHAEPTHSHSQTKSAKLVIRSQMALGSLSYSFVFIARKILLIVSIDFSFQNFPNRSKKNNQLDTLVRTQYFANTVHIVLGQVGRVR